MKNVTLEVLPSAARVASPSAVLLDNSHGNSGHFRLSISANADALQVLIEGYDKAAAAYYPLLEGDVENGVVDRVYRIGPGLEEEEFASANDVLPEKLRVSVRHFGTGSITYSVGAAFVSSS